MSGNDSSVAKGRYSAFLFDMDGTILNSIAAAERIWGAWAARHGLDVASFLPTIHGARAVDTVARLALPGVDPELEAIGITQAEIADVEGIVEVPGAASFLRSLPAAKWAVVTSAPRDLAARRMKAAGIPVPAILVTAEDVAAGKPNPDCYLLAASKLGVDAGDCLIFEDAPVGIAAGEAAGAAVMVVTATHLHPLDTPHSSIKGYQTMFAKTDADGFMLLEERGA
ncbi:sugar-phosphatase [Collimonas sp. PA-H2]|uniref:HAD-IA family hydrolase n=1 Tax=Collimonas sp. PA-H2 TaxID=1881062 RepID=UPI000BF46ABF|nr:HAD-IA family hydrolase [Collimonas sp. PA-H2]PFH04623.1 sugar-phosphatase [Collimonas sp. PA-H2]